MTLVVTLPRSAMKNPAAFAASAKASGAELLEIRGDLTPNVRSFRSSLPVLLSPRGREIDLPCRYMDLELHERRTAPKGTKLVLSFHDYEKTPNVKRLLRIVARMRTKHPWAVKIATTVRSERDLLILLDLQARLRRRKIRSVVLGMGPKAHLTRVLSPFRNVLTYAALDGSDASADGQLPLSFYKLLRGRKKPNVFGILGGPHVTSSLSPVIHNFLFMKHKIDAVYSCFPSTDFHTTVSALARAGVRGYSVTAPFKRDAFDLARTREALAEKLGVCNTLKRSGRRYRGWLTDAAGIEHGYPVLKDASSLAILGAGGAVPSAIAAARRLRPRIKITVFCRDPKKAKELRAFGVDLRPLSEAAGFPCDAVISAVSADVALPMPKANIAIDLRYGNVTRFLRDAKKRRMKTYDGVPMLICQALKQFRHFTGHRTLPTDMAECRKILSSFLPH